MRWEITGKAVNLGKEGGHEIFQVWGGLITYGVMTTPTRLKIIKLNKSIDWNNTVLLTKNQTQHIDP